MPFDCDHRRTHGPDACPAACQAVAHGAFAYVRADKAADLPRPEPGSLDVFVLDMNHGWPNIGHAARRTTRRGCEARPGSAAATGRRPPFAPP